MSTPLSLTALLGGLVLALSAAAAPAPAPALSDPIPVNPTLKLGKLDNGLSYYIQHNAKPAQRVELRLVVNAGALQEDDDQRGMAHLLEHLAFNGSTHFKKHELIAYLRSIGVRFGADLNAVTGFDRTIYMLPIPTDQPGNLEQGMTVLEDWAHGLTLNQQDIDDERPIVLAEKRQRSGYAMRSYQAMLAKTAQGTRYLERMPIGTEDAILHSTPAAIRRFYADWYRPDLMAVIMVGDLDPVAAEAMLKRHFGGLKMPAHPRPRASDPLPPLTAPDALVLLDPEAPANHLQLHYTRFTRAPAASVGDYRALLIRRLFAQMMGARYAQLTQVAEPPFVGGTAGEWPTGLGVNQYGFSASASVGKAGVNAAIDALVQESARARQFGFSADDLDVAKRNLLAGAEAALKARPSANSAQLLNDYVQHFLAGGALPGADQEYEYAQTLLPQISLEDVNGYARAIIPAAPPKLVLYAGHPNSVPAGQPAPAADALLARADSAYRTPLAKLEDKPLPASLMRARPAAGGIVAQTEDKTLGVTTLTLSNGVKVMLKPTDFNKNQVLMLALRPGGRYAFAEDDKRALRFASDLQRAMGVGAYSPNDLQRILAGKGLSYNANLAGFADQLSGSSRSNDLEALLQLNYLSLTQPRRDETLFRSFVARGADAVRNRNAMPELRFSQARLETVYGNNPLVELPPQAADYEAINLERSQQLLRARLSSVKGMTFLFVGDFDIDAIKPLLASYIATLPAGDLSLNYRDPGIRQVPDVVRRVVQAGIEPKSQLTFDFGRDLDYSEADARALELLNAVLNLRITDELREKQKLIYSGFANARYDKIPHGQYGLTIRLPTAPENVSKVEAALWGEIERLQTQGPDPAGLNKVKQAELQSHRRLLRENAYWIERLRLSVLEQRDPHEIFSVEQRLNSVSADDIKLAAQKFLDRNNYVEMVLMPER